MKIAGEVRPQKKQHTPRRATLRRLALFGALLALECLFGLTDLGFIRVNPVAITTMHLPVIICGIVLGPLYGGVLGGVFGLLSMLRATSEGVSKIDQLFSPSLSGQPVASWTMCVGTRVLLGLAAGLLFWLLLHPLPKTRTGTGLAVGITALLVPALHTVAVMGCLYLFFSAIPLNAVFGTIITLNGALEILVAVVVAVPVCVPLLYSGFGARGFNTGPSGEAATA